MRTLFVSLVALLVGLGLGYVPKYLELRDVQSAAEAREGELLAEMDNVRRDLMLSNIHSQLGVLVMQVRERRFDDARATSTAVYDGVNDAISAVVDADDERRLRTVAETRDQVTASLALNDPAVEETIWSLFGLLSASLP